MAQTGLLVEMLALSMLCSSYTCVLLKIPSPSCLFSEILISESDHFAGIVKLPTIYSEVLASPQMQFSVSVKSLNDKNVQLLDQKVEIVVAMAAVWVPLVPGM